MFSRLSPFIVTTVVGILGVTTAAQGGVIVDAVETGGNVVFSASGTIDQGGWTLIPNTGDDFAFIDPDGILLVGPTPAVASARFNNPTNFTGPDNFGPVPAPQTFASSGSGDILGLFFNSVQLVVPGGYVRDAALEAMSTYSGATFDSLGMTPGTYEWSWDTAGSRPRDFLRLNVISSGVPVPTTALLFALGFVGLVSFRRR